ncbi:chemotaxis protein CheX [Nocardioides caricicola]|uniref:Chemotaxis protein CheX n=1 Tax=Nocardioides caricicola TaxID=634770 RepID=A0ABW0N3W2_9ACTN
MTTGTAPDPALVHAAFEQVWGSMLFTAFEPWPADAVPELGPGVQAQIELRGDWNGRIILTCDTEVATQIAGAMLGAPAEEVLPDDDVHDAVGEVLNVVGGSVKGALGGVMSLGLPGVTEATSPPSPDSSIIISWYGAPVFVEVVPDAA